MTTHLIDRFMAACGADSPLPLRISCAGWDAPVVRTFHQPFLVLGRDPRNDLCLNSPAVSPTHAYLQVLGGSVFCVDLQSETGTHWPTGTDRNGWLSGGQPLRIGPFTLELANDLLEDADAFGSPHDWNPMVSRSAQPSRIPPVTLELLNTADKQPPRRLNRLLALVGSAPGCNVRLGSSTVSPVHCGLLRTPMGLWVVDLLGRDGVRVNGAELRYAHVQDGDEIQIGKFRLRVASEAARPPGSTAEMPATAYAVNGSSPRTAEPPPRVAPPSFSPADLSANSMPEMHLMRRDETLLVPLVQQFHLMQQQMFDQFQQAMVMVVQMFTAMHREQTDLVRKDLERVHQLTRELQTLQAELRNQKIANGTPPPPAPPEEPRPSRRPMVPPSATEPKPTTPPANESPSAGASDEHIHAWLTDRIAAIQQERQSQWQKLFKFLGGK